VWHVNMSCKDRSSERKNEASDDDFHVVYIPSKKDHYFFPMYIQHPSYPQPLQTPQKKLQIARTRYPASYIHPIIIFCADHQPLHPISQSSTLTQHTHHIISSIYPRINLHRILKPILQMLLDMQMGAGNMEVHNSR
jgi:hypothetical protein